jgi:hypothetical protein
MIRSLLATEVDNFPIVDLHSLSRPSAISYYASNAKSVMLLMFDIFIRSCYRVFTRYT